MDTQQKLEILADASQYDLACACGTKGGDDHRKRADGRSDRWLYPASLTARRIVKARKEGAFRSLRQVGLKGKRLATVARYVVPN